jgi:acyl transferase domain-containing protein/acyl carrier protein
MNDGSAKRALLLLDRAEKRIVDLERAKSEPIAIVGMGCRFPGGADSPEALFRLLDAGVDAVSELPKERYVGEKPPSGRARWAATIGDVSAFDPAFFGISPREAPFLDPQHRLLLEVAWEALEHAGLPADRLVGSKTGVFVGVCTQDYRDALVTNDAASDGYVVTGTMLSAAGGRLAYTFGFQGPCVTLDTACSSSLVSIHLAAQALRAGDADLALAGGVNLILSTLSSEALGDTQALSPDGRCKTFDARADGYVRGEGCGVIVLKRLSDALRDGDHVWAVVRGSAVNQDGRSSGLTAPNVLSQEALLRRAYDVARVSPSEVGYIEAHGTGTSLGDPIEFEALKAVLGAPRSDGSRCVLGSIKTNIGHLEAAAGIAGVIKAALALHHGRVPRHLHFRTLNPRIVLAGTPFVIAQKEVAWPRTDRRRVAGVSSFGMTGTNAHVVLEEAPAPASASTPAADRPAHLFLLSAADEKALRAQAERLGAYVAEVDTPLFDIAHTLAVGRASFEHRAAIVAGTREELAAELRRVESGEGLRSGAEGLAPARPDAPQVVFLYTGQGAQSVGMGRGLDETQPLYRAALDRCASVLDPLLGRPLRSILYGADAAELDRTELAQPALFAVEVALTELLRSWGIVPDAVLGHSVGEYAAAYAAGVFSLEDGCRLIAERGRLMGALGGEGAMIAVRCDAARVASLVEPVADRVSIAAYNGPRNVVVSGDADAVRAIGRTLEAVGVEVKPLRVSHAFHSPQMDPMLDAFERVVQGVKLAKPRIAMVANVSGALSGEDVTSPAYYREQIRRPVQFARGVRTLASTGAEVFIEVGPHPNLLALAAESAEQVGRVFAASLRRGKDDTASLLDMLARLFVAGCPIDFRGVDAPWGSRRAVLPTYPFQRERHWHPSATRRGAPAARAELPPSGEAAPRLHGRRLFTPARDRQHVFEVSVPRQAFLKDHRVYDALVVPGSYWIASMLSAADELLGGKAASISDVFLRQALVLASEDERRTACVVLAEQDAESDATERRITVDAYSASPNEANADGEAAEWHHHGTASVESAPRVFNAPPFDELRARIRHVVDVPSLYAKIGATRITLGDGFRWIAWLAQGEREVLARLERPSAVAAENGPIHPAQLDACFQALASSMNEGDATVARVPFGIERIELAKWAGDTLWVHGAWSGDPTGETVRFDGHLYDDVGAAIGEIVGLVMKVAPKDALLQARRAAWSDWTYELAYLPRPLERSAERDEADDIGGEAQEKQSQPALSWLLLDAAHDGVANAVAARLGAAGLDARVAPLGEANDATSALAAFDAEGGPPLAGVVLVETNPEAARDVERRSLVALVNMATLLSRRDPSTTAPRLAVLTRGAIATPSAPPVPHAAILGGAVRVAAQEHPELRPMLVDLDARQSSRDDASIDAIVAELVTNDAEVHVALRDGVRHVPRLSRARIGTKAERAFAVEGSGAYLVAGGLGGLGSRVAEWLVHRGAKDVVLVSRGGATDAHASALEALRASGANVEAVACDLASAEATLALAARLACEGRQLRGVVHAAGVLDDGVIAEQDEARIRRVLASKVDAADHLASMIREQRGEAWIAFFSSLSSVIGTAGQVSYAAANAYLDALAHRLHDEGIVALSVNWGAWRDIGMAARLDARERQRLADVGLAAMAPDDAIAAFDALLAREVSQVTVTPADWGRIGKRMRVGTLIEELLPASARKGPSGEATPLLRRLDQAEGKAKRELLLSAVKEQAARILGLGSAAAVDESKPLQSLGMDSLMAVELRDGLGRALGKTLPATLVFDHPTAERITQYLLTGLSEKGRARAAASKDKNKRRIGDGEPIAIVGMACRFPGGSTDPDKFWALLRGGVDAVTEVPKDRWDVDAVYDPDPDAPGKTYSRWGAFLDGVDRFDARLFGISPREAVALDPQQRLLLEVAYEAFEDANMPLDRLVGSQTGVFVGICFNDYARLMSEAFVADPYSATGNAFSVAAGRLSYVFGLEGPCVPIETACSSSLVSLHLACQAIRSGECDTAIAGGVNLILTPEMTMYFSRLHAMSKDGRCKAFDASANGYVRGEGCGIVVLKPLSRALEEGDRVLAVVRGSAVNQDGKSNGLTAPNGPAQEAVIRRALEQAGLAPRDIGYVETHGTGTPLGDPIEVQALGAALGEGRPDDQPLVIGSVKTNIGHTEGAAGIASVIKAILALRHGEIPPSLHHVTPNPHIPWHTMPVRVASTVTPWARNGKPRRAGVSSFGISGTNAHIILEEPPASAVEASPANQAAVSDAAAVAPRSAHLLPVSGDTSEALAAQAQRLAEFLANTDQDLANVAHTLAVGRARLDHRAAIVATDRETAVAELRAVASGSTPPRATTSRHHAASGRARRPKIAFLFTGQGSQYPGMGKALDASQPVYRDTLDRCAKVLDPLLGRPLRDILYSDDADALAQTAFTQPALFAVEVALAELWKSWGIEPDAVLGHSVGELAAACVAGVFSLEDGLRLIAERGRRMQALEGQGAMVAVRGPEARVRALVEERGDHVAIAACNGPDRLVVSGAKGEVDAIVRTLQAEGYEAKALRVSHAFHSPQMDPMLDAFESFARSIPLEAPRVPIASNVEGAISDAVATPGYWRRHVREAVRFEEGFRALLGLGCDVFVEVGPHPSLAALAADIAGERGEGGPALVPSLRRDRDALETALAALGALWVRGADVDFVRFDAPWPRARVALPTYAFQRERFWYEAPPNGAASLALGGSKHGALGDRGERAFHGVRIPTPGRELHYVLDVGTSTQPYLEDHKVYGALVVPGAFFVTAALTAATEAMQGSRVVLRDIAIPEPLLLGKGAARAQLVVGPEDARGERSVEVASADEDGSFRPHLTGTVVEGRGHAGSDAQADTVDLASVAARCREELSPSSFYDGALRIGFDLGARFRWITTAKRGDREVLARLERPADVEHADAPAHPTQLDACFQAMGLALTQSEGGDARVPFAIEELCVLARWDGPVWVHATWEEAAPDGTVRTDARVYDEDGARVGEIVGLRFKTASRAQWQALGREKSTVPAFELAWRERGIDGDDRVRVDGAWLVIGEASPLRGAVVAALQQAGAEAAAVVGTPEAIAAAVASCAAAPRGVLVLATDVNDRDPLADEARGWGPVLAAAQHAARLPSHPRFVVVTRGAQAVVPGDAPSPPSAAIWGLVRVVAQEHAELRPLAVDLEATGAESDANAEAAAIANELAQDGQLAFRGGKRFEARLRPARLRDKPSRPLALDSDATYLVTGGLGGLGLQVAGALVRKGARHLVLVGRSEPQPAARGAIASLEAVGAEVRVEAIDVTSETDVARLLSSIAERGHPLRGVVHAAGLLDDAMLADQDAARMQRVLAPKIMGASHLDRLTRGLPLDFFVLFSSLSSVIGGAAQAGYAAANAWLDALAQSRRAEGLPALSIGWGTWARVGMASRMTARDQERLTTLGLHALEPEEAITALFEVLERDVAHVLVAKVSWAKLASAPLLASLLADVAPRSSASRGGRTQGATDLLRALEKLGGRARRDRLVLALKDQAARVLGLSDANAVDAAKPLGELGLDSLMAVQLRTQIGQAVGKTLPATLVFDHPTLDRIADHLLASVLALGEGRATAAAKRARASVDEPIAIVGLGCRFPGGANDPDAFWELLRSGTDAVTEVPRDRWDIDAYYDQDPDAPGKMTTRYGGFLDAVDGFDAAFFDISPGEADAMDPQQRLLLEVSWEALEHAGLSPDRLAGSKTGVFVGICFNDYARLIGPARQTDPYSGMGNAFSVAAGRISYVLGLEGPCMAVDTACSSSLVTIHLACQALRAGECDVALAGGVNLMLAPETTVYFSRLRAMAPDGRCKTFDARANGYVRGEGCGVVVLKRLSAALADGDRVLAIVRGTAVNQDGKSNGLTAPNGPAQEAVIRRALEQAGVKPSSVGYVEAHGTGTPLGDPIELQALGAALGEGRAEGRPLLVGSVKTNIGHTEGAAGVAGVIKTVLALMHDTLPPSLHFEAPNPHVSWSELPLEVVREATPWARGTRARIAGVSSFGMSGTNAHVLLEEAPLPKRTSSEASAPFLAGDVVAPAPNVLLLSARTERALLAQAGALAAALERDGHALDDVAYTLANGRARLEHRAAVVARTHAEAIAELRSIESTGGAARPTTTLASVPARGFRPKVAFAFTGQGAQYAGMGRVLDATEPAYRAAIDRAAGVLDPLLGRGLRDVLYQSSSAELAHTALAQVAIVVTEYALSELLRQYGVEPDAVFGHSIGEIAAAHAAGVIALEDALRLAFERGRQMGALPAGTGMLAVEGDEAVVARVIARHGTAVEIAAYNTERRLVLAGALSTLDDISRELRAATIPSKVLRVSHAFHSAAMDPILDSFEAFVSRLPLRAPRLPMVSSLTGTLADAGVATAAYWRRHAREAVRFRHAARTVLGDGAHVIVEVGPHAALLPLLAELAGGADVALVSTLRRGEDDAESFAACRGALFANGVPIAPDALNAPNARRTVVSLPTYRFDRARHWWSDDATAGARELAQGASASTAGLDAHDATSDRAEDRDRSELSALFAIDWQEEALSSSAPDAERAYLVASDGAEESARIAAALAAAGVADVRIAPPTAHLVEGLHAPVGKPVTAVSLAPLEADDAHRAAACVRSLDRLLAAAPPGASLLVVARGATAGTTPRPNPHQAFVWGAVGALAEEHPGVAVLRVDVAEGDELASAITAALAREAWGPAESPVVKEPEVAFRNGRRSVPRLALLETKAPATSAARDAALDGTESARDASGRSGGVWIVLHASTPLGHAAASAMAALGKETVALAIASPAEAPGSRARDALEREARERGGAIAGVVVAGALSDVIDADAWTRAHPGVRLVVLGRATAYLGFPGRSDEAGESRALAAVLAARRDEVADGAFVACGLLADEFDALSAEERARILSAGGKPVTRALFEAALDHATTQSGDVLAMAVSAWPHRTDGSVLPMARALVAAVRPDAGPDTRLVQNLRRAPLAARRELLLEALRKATVRTLGARAAGLDDDRPLTEVGLDSLLAMQLRSAFARDVGRPLPATLLFDRPTLSQVATYLLERLGLASRGGEATLAATRLSDADDAVAIIGMACRYPGGVRDPEGLWSLVANGVDAISEVPHDRYDFGALERAHGGDRVPEGARFGGFIDGVDRFDAALFGIAPREAEAMDPQHRLLLETSWEALERSGHAPDRLSGTQTGVFVGLATNDYAFLAGSQIEQNPLSGLGVATSVAAGRISYALGLQGPAMVVDTACSSSLVALHLAVQALRSGECDLALAGGVNLILTSHATMVMGRLGALAPDGRCKTFDASANGYIRSDGCGALVLKRLSKAIADGDRVLAVVRGTAVNQDGRSNGLTAPNGPAQEAVIRRALENAGIAPSDVAYVEAHGTGTKLGDPIEVQALGAVLGEGRAASAPLCIGSIKTNIGHTEAAAGVAGVIKVVMALAHETIPQSLHFQEPSPHIPWSELPVRVASAPVPWRRGQNRRIAGVSSFGMSGTNAHVILEEPPTTSSRGETLERAAHVLAVSGHDERALAAQAEALILHLESKDAAPLADVAHTLAAARAHLRHRAAIVASTKEDAIAELRAVVAGREPSKGAVSAVRPGQNKPKVAFLFTGGGAQYARMGKKLEANEPVYRDALARVAKHLDRHLGRPIRDVIDEGDGVLLDRLEWTQPALFAVEYALTELWRSWGVVPAAVLGHSTGELVAACVAGVFSLEDACELIVERGKMMHALPDQGAMLAVRANAEDLTDRLKPWAGQVGIASYNGPESAVVSGARDAVNDVLAALTAAGIDAKLLRISHASHSPLTEPMLGPFEALVRRVERRAPKLPIVANVTGAVAGEELVDPHYWARQIREPVRFAQGVVALHELGCDVFLEIGPHPTLAGMARDCIDEDGDRPAMFLPSLRRGHDDIDTILTSLAALHVRGARVDLEAAHALFGSRTATLPTYAFQRERYWLPAATEAKPARAGHPLLGEALPSLAHAPDLRVWEAPLDEARRERLADATLEDVAVTGLIGLVRLAEAALGEVGEARDLVVLRPLAEAGGRDATLQIVVSGRGAPLRAGGRASSPAQDVQLFHRPSDADSWSRAASGSFASPSGTERANVRIALAPESFHDLVPHAHEASPRSSPRARSWVTRVLAREGELLAALRPTRDDTRAAALGDALEATLETVTLAAGLTPGSDEVVLPTAVARVASSGGAASLASAEWLHIARMRVSASRIDLDAVLVARGGVVVGWIDGLVLERVDRVAVLRLAGRDPLASKLFTVSWRPLDRVPPTNTLAGENARRCIVLGSGGALADHLAERVAAEGGAVSRYPADAGAAWASELASTPCLVVDLSPLDDHEAKLDQALAVLRAAIRTDATVPVLTVTRGAHGTLSTTVTPAHSGGADSDAASVWAARRVFAAEHRALGGALVDLEPAGSDARSEAAQLLGLLRGVATEDSPPEVAFRGDGAYVPRLTRVGTSPEPAALFGHSDVAERTCVVHGGDTASATAAARWLSASGASRVVIVRPEESLSTAERALHDLAPELEARTTEVTLVPFDQRDGDTLALRLNAAIPRVGLFLHLAGDPTDRASARTDEEAIGRVLDRVRLDAFAVLSLDGATGATVPLPGAVGAAAHASRLFALVREARRRGLRSSFVDAATSSRTDPAVRAQLAHLGLTTVTLPLALLAIPHAIAAKDPLAMVADLDVEALRAAVADTRHRAFFGEVAPHDESSSGPSSERLRARVRTLPPPAAFAAVADVIAEHAGRVLGLRHGASIPQSQPLFELGLESLMAAQLARRIGTAIGERLPVAEIFRNPTIADLARHVTRTLGADAINEPLQFP